MAYHWSLGANSCYPSTVVSYGIQLCIHQICGETIFAIGVVMLAGLTDSGHVEAGNYDGDWTASLDMVSGGADCEGYQLGNEDFGAQVGMAQQHAMIAMAAD